MAWDGRYKYSWVEYLVHPCFGAAGL
jgi:hypothetical protein